VQFRVLGPLEITAGGKPVQPGAARTQAVLAVLLAHRGELVPADRLTDELWPGHAPDRAAASLQVRLSELRKALRESGEADRLITRPPGYLLQLGPGELDAAEFEHLAAAGEAALAAGNAGQVVRLLDEALGLWRGSAFAGADAAASVRAEAGRLAEVRLAAVESRADAMLACGRNREIIGELEMLTASYPLRERFWYQRMLALYRGGRQADALRAYHEVRAMLVDELGVEPGPELRDLLARILRQDPELGVGRPEPARRTVPGVPRTRYVQSTDGVHIAYQVIGHDEPAIVFVPGLMSHLELLWEDEETADFFRRLATLGRLILFDKRDTGLSDRALASSTLEERVDDVLAVMRAVRSAKAVLFGYSEGAPMSILFAATYPERVSSLILGSAAARWLPEPGYPCGERAQETFEALADIAEHHWGEGASIEWYLPSQSGSAQARQLFARFERMAISPSAFVRMLRMIREIDVRSVLPAIHVPTLVIQRSGDKINPPCYGRYLQAHIAGARYFEQPGDHSLRFSAGGDNDALFAEIKDFLMGASHPRDVGRVLTTILAAPGLTGSVPVRSQVQLHHGRLVAQPEGTTLATFDAPGQAIRCAVAIRDNSAPGIQLRAGIHTGEVESADGGIAGPSVRVACGIATLAGPGEILISRTVRDLIAGSGVALTDRGVHQAAGPADDWPVFAVTGLHGS